MPRHTIIGGARRTAACLLVERRIWVIR